MKTIRFEHGMLISLLVTSVATAQVETPSIPTVPEKTPTMGAIKDSAISPGVSATNTTTMVADSGSVSHLDNAVAALNKGDKATTTQELTAGISGLEAEAQKTPTSFKTKLLAQASKLKALLPLIPTGALGSGVLGKAVSLAKLASGGNQLEGLLAAGSLIGKGSQLTSGLSGISSALSALGGQSSKQKQSLVSSALATVGKLDQGGLLAKAAEPAAKTEVSSILNLVKGVL